MLVLTLPKVICVIVAIDMNFVILIHFYHCLFFSLFFSFPCALLFKFHVFYYVLLWYNGLYPFTFILNKADWLVARQEI